MHARPSTLWFPCRFARREHVDDDSVLSGDVNAMGGVVGRHNQGLVTGSNGPDDASGPSGKLARFLSGQADGWWATASARLRAGPNMASKRSTISSDGRSGLTTGTIFVVAWPLVDPSLVLDPLPGECGGAPERAIAILP